MTEVQQHGRSRRPREPFIPGLIPSVIIKGSRHRAPCPTLQTSEIDEETGHCTFEWQAKGSREGSVYQIRAIGKLEVVLDQHDSVPRGIGLTVTCSCPDGERQAAVALSQNKPLTVCKHGYAALESVLDEQAQGRHEREIARLRQVRAREAAEQRAAEERAREEQDRDMPGERQRIEYGLSALSEKAIVRHLSESCKTAEGLRALTSIFPEAIMPIPQTNVCARCKKTYDERFDEQRVCRMRHPDSHTRWDGSKIPWEECRRCGGDFDVPENYRGVYDAGEWCFQGKHTQDEDLVKKEKWDGDYGDY